MWSEFVTEDEQHVEGAPGRWSPLPDGRPGLRVRAEQTDGIRLGDVIVDGEATLFASEVDGPSVAVFPDGSEGVAFSPDGKRYMLRVWNPASPWAQRFHDIAAFPEDPDWVVEATVTPIAVGSTMPIDRTREALPVDTPALATLEFSKDGATYRLVATVPGPEPDEILVHFRDGTSGTESYGAGRALWLDLDDVAVPGVITLDFNRATLMPCSFSRAWNCPLPPRENTLPVPVRAGERHAVDVAGDALL
ncbi:MAG: hypothetical protein JWM34_1505 [Ilumatobacteraceae bacterium]|nr:hypothetical protein [Ilumatobacteraceae bacterium]